MHGSRNSSQWSATNSVPVPAAAIQARQGTLSDLPADERFDAVVYLDVLEHIEADRAELIAAANRLTPSGHLVVLAPAFQSLYSEFDRAIGHYRRYTITSLKALTPPDTIVVYARYLDAAGACLSAANRLILSRTAPTSRNIRFWDRCVIPISRVADHVLGRLAGRSVVCVWQKDVQQSDRRQPAARAYRLPPTA